MQTTISPDEVAVILSVPYTELAEYAQSPNVPITIEPINCFESDDDFVNRVANAMAIIVQVDSSKQGVFVDCFYINIEDSFMDDAMTCVDDKRMHIHLADSNRVAPSGDPINFAQMFNTLKTIKFDGYMSFDCVLIGRIGSHYCNNPTSA